MANNSIDVVKFDHNRLEDDYPLMYKYLSRISPMVHRQFIGREDIVDSVLATLNRPEISNAALVGEPGTGKTTIVYGVASKDRGRMYYEVQTSLLSMSDGGYDGAVEMGSRLTRLFKEVEEFQKEFGVDLVLFIDEFHVIMETSSSAMEALKPVLSNSGVRNIKLILATTLKEYSDFIRKNSALNERLERVLVPEFDDDMTFLVLQNMYKSYLPHQEVDTMLLRRIVSVTNRAVPSQKQPRKSIRLLDAMLGWHRTFGTPIDDQLLFDTVHRTLGVNINYDVNVELMKAKMNNRVFDQSFAVESVTDQIYLSVANLRNDRKTRGSFLFTGPTGVGKTQLAKEMTKELYGSEDAMLRFDMSEFSEDRAGAVDVLQRSLTRAVTDRAEVLILVDEVEKGSRACTRLFLQVLDDARLTDENGLEVSFKDVYVVFTTNEGAHVFETMHLSNSLNTSATQSMGETPEQFIVRQRKVMKEYDKLLRQALSAPATNKNAGGFPVELLGRIDKIVPFTGLEESTRTKIFNFEMKDLTKRVMSQYGVRLHIDSNVRRFIVSEKVGANSTSNGGGREVMKRIGDHILAKLSKFLLDYPEIRDVAIGVSGKMSLDDKYDNEGDAEIVVGRWVSSESRV